jgi:hypothetical protein
VPAWVKLALAAFLVISILRAFFGEPPTCGHRADALRAALAGATCYLLAVAVAYLGYSTVACGLIVAAVEAMCFAVWLARGRDDPGQGGRGHGPVDPPVDWAEFDRLRADWGRQPTRPLVPTS